MKTSLKITLPTLVVVGLVAVLYKPVAEWLESECNEDVDFGDILNNAGARAAKETESNQYE